MTKINCTLTTPEYSELSLLLDSLNGTQSLSTIDYCFTASLLSKQRLPLCKLINHQAHLHLQQASNKKDFHCIISKIVELVPLQEYFYYKFTLHSPIYLLKQHTDPLTLHQPYVTEVINYLCQPISSQVDPLLFKFNTRKRYQGNFIQHEQTSYASLLQLLATHKITARFEQDGDSIALCFYDKIEKITQHNELDYLPNSQLVRNTPSIYYLKKIYALEQNCWQTKSDYLALEPGQLLTIEDLTARIQKIKHHIKYNGYGFNYQNEMVLQNNLKGNIKLSTAPIVTAKIKNIGTKQQQYEVDCQFDRQCKQGHTIPATLLQPHGMIFPLAKNMTTAAVFSRKACNRLYLLGVLFDSQTPNPITANNNYLNKLQTPGKNSLLVNEQKNKSALCLSSKGNQLLLDATKNKEKISLLSEHGSITFNSAADLTINAKKNVNLQTQGSQNLTINTQYQLKACGHVSLQSAKNLSLLAKKSITLSSASDCNIEANKNILLNVNGNFLHQIAHGDFSCVCEQGSITFQSGRSIKFTSTTGSIKWQNAGAQIHLDPVGTLSLNCRNLSLNAKIVRFQGNVTGDL